MSGDIEYLAEQVAQLTAVLNELRDQGHAYVGVVRSSATENQLVNERTLQQSKATEESLKATIRAANDSMAQTLKSFSATAVDTGGKVAGDLGEVFGSKARREIDPLVNSLQKTLALAQQVTEQQRSGLRWITWGGYGLGAVSVLGLAASLWWNLELRADNEALIAQLTESRQALAAPANSTKPKLKPSNEKPPSGAR